MLQKISTIFQDKALGEENCQQFLLFQVRVIKFNSIGNYLQRKLNRKNVMKNYKKQQLRAEVNNQRMNIVAKISNKLVSNILTTQIAYNASKMQASSTQNTKDSAGKRLGLKKFGGEQVMPGDVIARQRGFKWKSGQNVIVGKDQTIHAKVEGVVTFRDSLYRKVPYKIIDVVAKSLPNKLMKHPAPYNYHPELFPERAKLNHPPIQSLNKKSVSFKNIEKA